MEACSDGLALAAGSEPGLIHAPADATVVLLLQAGQGASQEVHPPGPLTGVVQHGRGCPLALPPHRAQALPRHYSPIVY